MFVRNSNEFLEGCDIRIVQNSSFEFRVTHEMTHHPTKNKTKDGKKKQILFIFDFIESKKFNIINEDHVLFIQVWHFLEASVLFACVATPPYSPLEANNAKALVLS